MMDGSHWIREVCSWDKLTAFSDVCACSKSLQQDRVQVNGHYELTVGEAEEVFAFVNQGFRFNVNHFFSRTCMI